MNADEIERVLLIPGLMEPQGALLPLRQLLRKDFQHVEIWKDRYAFRNVENSVSRLIEKIGSDPETPRLAIVTHSFGDWVARQAIARTPDHRVAALVSIAPVMACGLVPRVLHWLGGDILPEIAIIANADRAAAALQCDPSLRRMVIWAASDIAVARVDLSHLRNVETHRINATHLSVVLQPNVHRLVQRFLQSSQGKPTHADQVADDDIGCPCQRGTRCDGRHRCAT